MSYVLAGANLSFKTGDQSTIETMLSQGTSANATHGAFYLTKDTHRLYVGNSDGSISPVNEGITFVSSINNLPDLGQPESATSLAYQGRFYYITNANILCVASGNRWVQINPDTRLRDNRQNGLVIANTSTNVVSLTMNVEEEQDGNALGDGGHKVGGTVQLIGGNNVTLTPNVTNRTVTISVPNGATYDLEAVAGSTTGTIDLRLVGSNSTTDVITLAAGTGYSFDLSQDGSTVTLNGGGFSGANAAATFTVNNGVVTLTVKDSALNQVQASIAPKIKIGNTEQTITPTFNSATNELIADLDVYTIAEIDALLARQFSQFEGMYFAGTVGSVSGTNGTYATLTAVKNATDLMSGATLKFISSQATVPSGMTIEGWNNEVGAVAGDMLIITGLEYQNTDSSNTTTYTTNAALVGTIVPSTAEYHFIPSGDDEDIYFTPNFDTGTDNVIQFVKSDATNQTHKLTFSAGNQIALSDTTSNATGGGKEKEITISHGTITTTPTTGSAVSMDQTVGSPATSFTAITGITTSNGHVTGYTTQQLSFWQNALKTVSTTATDATSGTNSAVSIATTYIDQTNTQVSGNYINNMKISSDTLTVGVVAAGSANGSTKTDANISINMVWGSF